MLNSELIASQSSESVVDLSFRPSLRSDLMCNQVHLFDFDCCLDYTGSAYFDV